MEGGAAEVRPGRSRDTYAEKIASVSARIIVAQRPIRILHAIAWPDAVRKRFFAEGARELPAWEYPALTFDAPAVQREFREIARALDGKDPVHRILRETCEQYARVTEMLAARATPRFHQISSELYGAPGDALLGGSTTNLDLARHLGAALGHGSGSLGPREEGRLSDVEAAGILRRRLSRYFKDDAIVVEVSSRLTVDAAAGANRIRVRKGGVFTRREVKFLEHHEGQIHVATTLNGLRQPFLKCLAKASPRSTRYNEGLAVFSEWAGQSLTVRRLLKLKERVLAVRMAEQGGDFLDIYRHHLDLGCAEEEAFEATRRVFRGADVRGRWPFTKDASYLFYFIRVFTFLRAAIRLGRFREIDMLFAGKIALEDIPVLRRLQRKRLVVKPRYLPPWARNKDWLACHMALSSFVDGLPLSDVEREYESLLGSRVD
jgi:uncharacterized protein (TIGR02421 family)